MEEQELVVHKEEVVEEEEEEDEEEGGGGGGTEREQGEPIVVQVKTIEDFMNRGSGLTHIKTESEEETHRYWDSEWHDFLKSVAWLSPGPPSSEEEVRDFQASLERAREEAREGSSGEATPDANVRGKAWIGRKKLDSCRKMKETLEKMGMERQWPLHLKPFCPPDVERARLPAKRKNANTPEGIRKKQRKVISLNLKMKIIKAYADGKKVTNIAREEGLAHSTISAILKDKERIREAIKGSSGMNVSITRQRKGLIHEMEKLLILWIEDQIQKRLPMNLLLIQNKARSIFSTLKERAGEECTETFTASRGWFIRFQQRFHFQKTHTSGETATGDEEAAKRFLNELDGIITEGNYFPAQIFSMDETGLYWKRMPERTYIHKEAQAIPGCKSFKDRVTVLLGGNVAGFKLKPFVVYKSDHSCMFKNVSKTALPIHYRSDPKAWITPILFDDWFMNCFIPQVKEYCWQKGIPFRILLLLSKAPGYPPDLESLHPHIKIVYLPPNTSVLLQPMSQGAISAFKAYYLHEVFVKALATMEDESITLSEFWKSYNILDCIENIVAAWQGVSVKCMQGIWKKCLKCFAALADNLEEFDPHQHLDEIYKNILTLTKSLDLEVDAEDVKSLIAYTEGELSNEDLIELKEELEEQKVVEEEVEKAEKKEERKEEVKKVVEVQPKTFSLRRLASVFSGVNKILSELESMDPDVERFRRVHWEMREILKCYREIYEEKRKESVESRHGGFLKKVTSSPVPVPSLLPFRSTVIEHPDDPQPSTSYARGSDVPENSENHESFKGYISDLMFTVIPKNTMLKSPKQEEETFEIVKVKIPMDIKQESDGEAN
ncbi:tigger transposable element-derived protein 1-like [Pseudonaja textilis]|uniref:tigger transposable element-derived protein 1-like n=1 Tax=Pseudonaja textilis TaxID=8673 RepID=UPI000EA9D938|nr:tigger transposable element-derived protein 1-like [Pseudonaja textilis]XP_026577828.1 tigger transposable element-derived protein 1-like [Pseudonaja textilis]XP_026577829.1 tigger transposable element-derived protein 1-like [Pseudonaja textilis]XP_026577830.1 tigger transposable element-derived protein 1-like [Pseudonaja textilis]